MGDPLLYDWSELFYDSDFSGKAMDFFRAVGHTITVTPLIIADDVLHCIYSELNFNAYYERTERTAFSCIESLSYLFSLDNGSFYKIWASQINYYAVSLNTDKSERTVTANTIINAFAKSISDYIVILFRHEKKCMLSFAKKANSYMTFFSDWFDESSASDIVGKIDIGNLSLQNSNAFFFDFAYMAARSYYTQPISWDYAKSEWYSGSFLSDGEEDYTRPSRIEYVNDIMYAHIYEYGDDYIEPPGIDDYQKDIISDGNFDFDLMELELDEMMAAEVFEMDDDEYRDDKEVFYDEIGRIDTDNIPPEILNDPVQLVEWLRKNEQLNEEESSESW